MAGVEAARVSAHADDACFLLHFCEALGISERIGNGDLDLNVFSRAHALLALLRVHLRGCREDHRFEAGLLQAFCEIARPMRDLEFLGHFFRGGRISARQSDDFDVRNFGDALEMLLAKRALSRDSDLHLFSPWMFDFYPTNLPQSGGSTPDERATREAREIR